MDMKLSPSLRELAEGWFDQAKAGKIPTSTRSLLKASKSIEGYQEQGRTVYTRSWRGRVYQARVDGVGVECNGEIYGSLTAAAQAITGQVISGPRFFRVGQ